MSEIREMYFKKEKLQGKKQGGVAKYFKSWCGRETQYSMSKSQHYFMEFNVAELESWLVQLKAYEVSMSGLTTWELPLGQKKR